MAKAVVRRCYTEGGGCIELGTSSRRQEGWEVEKRESEATPIEHFIYRRSTAI